MDLKILFAVQDASIKEKYVAAMTENESITCHFVTSLKEMTETLQTTPYNGIIIDLSTKTKATNDEKEMVTNIIEQYPTAHAFLDKKTKEVKIINDEQHPFNTAFDLFIQKECMLFPPRKIRMHARKDLNYNILLCHGPKFNEADAEKTISLNVSKGGCFLFSSTLWLPKDEATLVIKDFQDKTPIYAQVVWSVPWGKTITVPGVGLQFFNITKNQLMRL